MNIRPLLNRKQSRVLLAGIGVVGVLASIPGLSAAATPSKVTLAFKGLPALQGGTHYEAWAETKGTTTSMGKFLVTPSGKLTTLKGNAKSFRASKNATGLSVTVETAGDSNSVPSQVRVVAGEVRNGRSSLSSTNKSAIGSDLSTAKGDVLVAAPTAPKTDPLAGVWWYNPVSKGPSITIPALSSGWIYEGWVVLDGVAVTTGQFNVNNEADLFNGYSGEGGVPAVPGEDFVKNPPTGLAFPRSVQNSKVFITVEPKGDGDVTPFGLTVLTSEIPTKIAAFESVPMRNVGTAITGTATFR